MQPCGRHCWSCWAGLPTPLRPPSWPELLLRCRPPWGTGSAVCVKAGPSGILGCVGGLLAGHPGQIPGHGGAVATPSGRRQRPVPRPCGRSKTASDHRGLGRLPQLARHHGRPFGSATRRSRPRRLGARLAVPRVADSQPLLSRPRAVANHAARPPGHASLPIRPARRLLACRYPERQPPRSRRKPCKLRFGDDCACPSQLPPTTR